MEKVLDEQFRDWILVDRSLHPTNKHAHQKSKSCHKLVSKIEQAKDFEEIAVAIFLDIQGAFDNKDLLDSVTAGVQGNRVHTFRVNRKHVQQ